jgi:hypothetical protein
MAINDGAPVIFFATVNVSELTAVMAFHLNLDNVFAREHINYFHIRILPKSYNFTIDHGVSLWQ